MSHVSRHFFYNRPRTRRASKNPHLRRRLPSATFARSGTRHRPPRAQNRSEGQLAGARLSRSEMRKGLQWPCSSDKREQNMRTGK